MNERSKRVKELNIIAILAASVAGWAQTATTQPATAALSPEVDKILTRLEQREVRDLHADVKWHQHYIIETAEDDVTKRGEIWYQADEPVGKFLIHFTDKITGRGRHDKLDERHLFDGRWYVELQSRSKTVTRREIRKPDDQYDPYKVGEGVFPMPFGQKKEDILREFDVEQVALGEDAPPHTERIRLTPKEGSGTGRSYKTLDFWVQKEGPLAGLPIKVKAAKKSGTGRLNSFITITFSDVELNPGFSRSLFRVETPPGYHEIVERLEPAAAPPGARETE